MRHTDKEHERLCKLLNFIDEEISTEPFHKAVLLYNGQKQTDIQIYVQRTATSKVRRFRFNKSDKEIFEYTGEAEQVWHDADFKLWKTNPHAFIFENCSTCGIWYKAIQNRDIQI